MNSILALAFCIEGRTGPIQACARAREIRAGPGARSGASPVPCAGMKRRIAQRFRPGKQRVRAIRQDTTASARGHESVRRLGKERGACAHSVPGRNGGAWLRRCLRVRRSAQAMAPVTHAKSCTRGLHSQLSARLAAGERRDKAACPGALAGRIELSDADPVQGSGNGPTYACAGHWLRA